LCTPGVQQGGISTLSASQWEFADHVVCTHQPFYAAMLELSSDDACISVVVPLTAMLLEKPQSTGEDRSLLQLKAALRDSMNRRFAHIKREPHIIVATLFDPRFRDAYFNAEETAAAVRKIRNFLRSVQPADRSVTDAQPSTSSQTDTSWTATPTTISTSLWEAHDNLEQTTAANEMKNFHRMNRN